MKVSLIIPAYNEEKYIDKSLTSVFNQSVLPDEIILGNNNSTDRTVEIASKFEVKIINEKKQGMTHARNRGFDEAKYEIIARTDSDAILSKDWVKNIKKNFEKGEFEALTGPVSFYDLFKNPTSPKHSEIYLEILRAISKGKRFVQGPNMSLTKNVWLKVRHLVNLDDSQVHEDLDLSMWINKVGGKIGFDQKLKVQISA